MPVGRGSVVVGVVGVAGVVGVVGLEGVVVADGTVDVGLVTGGSMGLEKLVAVVGSASVVVVMTVVGVSVRPPVMVGMAYGGSKRPSLPHALHFEVLRLAFVLSFSLF